MREEWHVYLTRDGRMSMAGMKSSDVAYVASAMKGALSAA
jgi:aspartate/tyrosine/aromatic aminotransferase